MWRIITLVIRLYLACRSFCFLKKLYWLSRCFFPFHFIFFIFKFYPKHKTPPSRVMKYNSFGSFTFTMLKHTVCLFCAQNYMLRYVCCLSSLFSSYYDVTIADEMLQLKVYNHVLCAQVVEQWRLFVVPRLLWHSTSIFKVTSEDPRCSHLLLRFGSRTFTTCRYRISYCRLCACEVNARNNCSTSEVTTEEDCSCKEIIHFHNIIITDTP